MKQFFYHFLALFFYHLGDKSWNTLRVFEEVTITRKLFVPVLWSLYQKAIHISLKFDSKTGYKLWKLPNE
jgi:hypothetical protein